MRGFLSTRSKRMLVYVQLKTQLYIDGKWIDGKSTMPVTDPSDESIIANHRLPIERKAEA